MSWNLKDFGTYDYSATMEIIAQTVIENQVDVLMIMEVVVNRSAKRLRISSTPPTDLGSAALLQLYGLLQEKDPGGNWDQYYTKNSCANQTRDAYALFFRTSPHGEPPEGAVLPDIIEIHNEFKIYRYTTDLGQPRFEGGRRPAGCNLKFSSNAAEPSVENAILMNFHALAEKSSLSAIKRSVGDCIEVANAQAEIQGTGAVIVSGDFNVNYKGNEDWYGSFGYHVAITTNGGSSLLAAPDFDSPNVVLAGNAFDNFLYSDDLICADQRVISVIEAIMEGDETLESAYLRYYPTHKVSDSKKAAGVSDHLPIVGDFIFNSAGPSQ